jgi:aminoglycoside 3'-phosphotransferase-2
MEAPDPFTDGMPLPWAWQETLADARIERQSIGVSRADVARVHRPGQADAFLKSEVIDAFSELGDEIARLRWLQAQGQPAPTVIATAEEAGRRWLLMSAARPRPGLVA